MSIDALRLVSEYLTPTARVNLARVNASTGKALSRWEDVHSVLFDDTKVIFAGEVFRHQIDTGMDLGFLRTMNDVFRLCPHSRRIWIHTRLRSEQVQVLQEHADVIEILNISSENFDTRYPLTWDKVKFKRLRSLNILQRMDQPLNLRQLIDKSACQALLPFTLRHVCLTGIVLSAPVMDALMTLTNLRHLELMGCVIDTQLAAKYIDRLAEMSNLDELSVPPSMFSFSVKDETNQPPNMRKLHLSKISIYMDCFEENTFFDALETIMPKKLESLTLYGNFYQLKRSKKYAQWRKFDILFGSMTPQVRTPWWLKDDSILMSHLVRCQPYKISDDFRPVRTTATSWRFDQSTLENEETRVERQPTINRFLRFVRPENAPLAIAPAPRVLPEPPPPPVRRERIRRRPSVPTVVEEPNTALPVLISLPPPGAVAAPLTVMVPAGPAPGHGPSAPVAPHHTSPAAAPPPHGELHPAQRTVVPGRSGAHSTPTRVPLVQASNLPSRNVSLSTASSASPVMRTREERAEDRGRETLQMAPSGPVIAPAQAVPRHSVQFEEVPASTPSAPVQPQPIVEHPDEAAALHTRPQPPEPEMNRAQVGQEQEQHAQRIAAGNAAVERRQPEQARNAGEEARERERQADDDNVNLMLQGMLQALVEEIVFDAINEERMDHPTDPPPVVSSDATAPNRTNATNTSTTTRTPATPPPTEAQPRQMLNQANNQANQAPPRR
ncbi:unnamed protein product [Cylicocyclus nassatus]|uniref:Uncharacterized protein n=1 Tax=Cylicocyclus nassatus TaxID=53992 RepID=A0AA36DU74_CYLNA|nr:unnamed protein product [Cylicocyclus nassatus]